MTNANTIENLKRSTVYSQDGEKIGKVGVVYVDADSSQPTFVTVNTGLFGTNESFIPVNQASYNGDDITVPFSKEFVKDAPNIAEDGELSPEEEQRIYDYYNGHSGITREGHRGDATAAGTAAGIANDRNATAGVDQERRENHADRDGDVVAHEERLNVSNTATARETGRVRLRKVVHTDTETVEVPVRREEIHVEREKIDPNSAEARTNAGYDFKEGEEDVTVTAYEERPNVTVDTVATERVNVSKDVHTDTERVQGEVRKEEIRVEGDDVDARDRKDRI
ncbi:MAG: PRC and DUF2382 domain-containing protein [Rothia sp. (in: high G+C Gram-positive bacteria)]|nr:PRC and DUF2382 domain-containing protein [Rothia sp. (in: high G+C Gram-positive bacteria)]